MFTKPIRKEVYSEIPFDVKKVAPIDQYDSKDFNINESGFIRNDISKLARAQSIVEYDAIMKRIGIIQPQYGVSDDMTLRQAFESIRPRSLQNPCELAYWAEHIKQLDDAYRVATDAPIAETDIKPESVVETKSE